MDEIIKKINAHALSNYDKGWDTWVECLDDSDRIEIFEGATSYDECFKKAVLWVAGSAEGAAIGAENCALYDTGIKEDYDRYVQYQENAKLARKAADMLED
jgi:hypothetical protein